MKKTLAFVLALLMMFPLIACANNTETTPPPVNETTAAPVDTTAPSSDAAPETTLPPETELTPSLPDVGNKYKDTEFSILHRGTGYTHYNEPWMYAAEITGDTINDAVYKRNSYIEEKYGLKIVEHIASNPADAISVASNSQDDIYDVAYPQVNKISNCVLQGMVYDLHELPYLDFEKPWWDSNLLDTVSYKGQLFIGVSDTNLSVATRARAMTFNRDLIRKFELDDPYDLVKNNQWTLEKMITMIRSCSEDVDGDSKWTDADVYGLLAEEGDGNSNVNSILIGSGVKIFDMDNEDQLKVTMFTEKTMNVLDVCRSFLLDKTTTRAYGDLTPTSGDKYTFGRMLFSQDHYLFYLGSTRTLDELVNNNMESEYGVVPVPKFDAEQENYYHRCDRNASVLTIPATNQADDLERLSIILEDMSYMSSKTVLVDYYETIIKLRRARVPELGEMVDLIKNSVYYDFTFLFTVDYIDALEGAFNSGNYSSTFTRYERNINNSIKQLQKKLDALG